MKNEEYKELFNRPELWELMTVIDFERMCYFMNTNPYEEWNKQLMRDEDYIKMMCSNKAVYPDNGILKIFKDMDSKKFHKIISFIKSGIRILACLVGVYGRVDVAFGFLLSAEVFGILEEFKE